VQSAETVQRLKQLGLVPIVRTPDAESAVRSVEAICEGGIPCAEITMTVQGAIHALEKVADEFGDRIILGAGTVLDPETARACMLAGAEFFVTPALNLKTIELAKRYSKAIFPGALTPTEILSAWEAGGDAIKVFPCSALGGAKYIKALKGPLPHVELVPTGGVNLETITDFFEAGCSAVGVGSELVDAKTVAAGKYEVFAERARQFRAKVTEARAKAAAESRAPQTLKATL
jgi:2-dehydro-3-deoxyphosphogluconate aldolase/(4S)-4-hydroxy-2-oxoglutarate aldolase